MVRRSRRRSAPTRRLAGSVAAAVVAATASAWPAAAGGAPEAIAPTAPARPAAAAGGAAEAITAGELLRRLAGNEVVDLKGVTVEGDVDLRSLGTVTRSLRCDGCRFTGAVTARDVVFERLVALDGAEIAGPVDLEGADLRDRASFEGAVFEGPLSLTGTRFGDRVSFAGADFRKAAAFGRAHFTRGLSLAKGEAGGSGAPISFDGAELSGDSDFGGREFNGPASFAGTVFGGRVSFALARFHEEARFDDCVARSGATFRVALFSAGASFDRCRGEGSFELDGAFFGGETSFHGLTVSGPLVLRGIRVGAGGELDLEQVSSGSVVMDVALVETVRGPAVREVVLAQIEATAQARGDLRTANDARYGFLVARSRHARGAHRVLDAAFYRGVAGYLVRPLHPLSAFGLLLLVGVAARVLAPPAASLASRRSARGRRSGAPEGDAAGRPGPAVDATVRVLGALQRTLKSAFSVKAGISVDNPNSLRSYFVAGLRWAEFLAYKAVTAVFVITIANSNATSRQLLDALRG